jgi:carbon storage regulator
MLVLSRKINERIVIDGQIRVTVLGLRGNQIRIGIEAPSSIKVIREELLGLPQAEHAQAPELVRAAPAPTGFGRVAGPLASVIEKHHAGAMS